MYVTYFVNIIYYCYGNWFQYLCIFFITGFNKRLVDDLLVESLEAMGHKPCKDESLAPLKRLKTNIQTLLNGTVPKEKMAKFQKENKSTEDILELLTNEKK